MDGRSRRDVRLIAFIGACDLGAATGLDFLWLAAAHTFELNDLARGKGMNILKEVKMVLWGFVGLGDRNRARPPTGRPLVLIAVAFVLLGLFLGTLVTLAKLAASST